MEGHGLKALPDQLLMGSLKKTDEKRAHAFVNNKRLDLLVFSIGFMRIDD